MRCWRARTMHSLRRLFGVRALRQETGYRRPRQGSTVLVYGQDERAGHPDKVIMIALRTPPCAGFYVGRFL